MTKPPLELEARTYPDGEMEVLIEDLGALMSHVGEDLFVDLVGCAIQADRLASLSHSLLLAILDAAPESVRLDLKAGKPSAELPLDEASVKVFQKRQFTVVAFFALGTLRELSLTLPRLRGRLLKAGVVTKGGWPKGLQAVEDFVNKHRSLIDLRDQLAFHMDSDRLLSGLRDAASRGPQTLIRMDSKRARDHWFEIGHEATFRELGADDKERKEVFAFIFENLNVMQDVEALFLRVVEMSGVGHRKVEMKEVRSRVSGQASRP